MFFRCNKLNNVFIIVHGRPCFVNPVTNFSTGLTIVAATRDYASANNAAMKIVKVIYPSLLYVGYFSHTLDLVNNHFKLPNLTVFQLLAFVILS